MSTGLNLRASASTASSIVALMPAGTLTTVIGGPQAGGGYTWWRLSTPYGRELGGRRVSGESGECRNIDADADAQRSRLPRHQPSPRRRYRHRQGHLPRQAPPPSPVHANRNCHPDHNRHTADADTEQHGDLNSDAFENGDIHVDCNPDPDTNVDPDSDGDTVDVRGVYCGSHGENDHRPEPARTPSTSGTIIALMPTGTRGVVIGGPVSANGFTWCQLQTTAFGTGWAAATYLAWVSGPLPALHIRHRDAAT